MDNRRLFLAVTISMAILLAWQPLMVWMGYIKIPPQTTTQNITSEPSTQQALESILSSTQPINNLPIAAVLPTTQQVAATGVGGLGVPLASGENPTVSVGSAIPNDPTYHLQVNLSRIGGGVQSVVLNPFKQNIKDDTRYTYELADPSNTVNMPLSVKQIKINGSNIDLSKSVWTATSSTDAHVVKLSLDIGEAPQKLLTIVKTFTLSDIKDPSGNEGYEVSVDYQFINHTNVALTIQPTIVGPNFPPGESQRGGDRQVLAGYAGRTNVVVRNAVVETIDAKNPKIDFSKSTNNESLLWIGSGNQYFNAILRPIPTSKAAPDATVSALPPDYIGNVTAEVTALDSAVPIRYTNIETKDLHLEPQGTLALPFKCFFGPRQRDLLKNSYYGSAGLEYYHTLEINSCFCTFPWLVNLLMKLLGILHGVVHDWGVAIILMVFVVRAILHPINRRAQMNMAKMAKMGPEIERIKKKFGDDKEAINRAMMDFYKQNGATPIMGCLPMFLQMPIWIALYSGISNTFDLRHQPFLYGFTWIKDLSQPDHLITFPQPISLIFTTIDSFNIIPICLAVLFFIQARLQPKPAAMSPEQEQQQKMMQWMTVLMFPIIMYKMPSGLNMYTFTSTLFGIIESRIIRSHIKRDELLQAGKGPIVADAEIIDRKSTSLKAPEVKKGGFFGWIEQMQQRAEQLKNDVDKKQRRKK